MSTDTADRTEVDTDLTAALAAHAKVLEMHLPSYTGGPDTLILKIDLPDGMHFERRYRTSRRAWKPEQTMQGFPSGDTTEIRPVPYARLWRLMSRINKNRDTGPLEHMLNTGAVTRTQQKLSLEGARAFQYEPANP